MAGFSGISGLMGPVGGGAGGAGGLGGLLQKIPGPAGDILGAVAPLATAAASLIPGGAVAGIALDAAGGIATSAMDAKKQSDEITNRSSITY